MLANNHFKVLCVEGKANHYAFAAELAKKGYQVRVAENGTAGLNLLADFTPMMVVINAASLRTNGKRLSKRFRACLPNSPILLIVPDHTDQDDIPEVNAILTLPFTVQKLVNRMHLFQKNIDGSLHIIGPLQLNPSSNLAIYKGKECHLTPRLTRLLLELMKNHGKIVPRTELFQEVWETDYTGDTRTLDVHISWLRHKLEDDPRDPTLILTIRSMGYKLNL